MKKENCLLSPHYPKTNSISRSNSNSNISDNEEKHSDSEINDTNENDSNLQNLNECSLFLDESLRNNDIRRWSLNISSKSKKVLIQKAVEIVPSKLHKSFSFNGNLMNLSCRIEEFSNEIERNNQLMEDNDKFLATIKRIPEPLSVRRQIKAKVSDTINRNKNTNSLFNSTALKKFTCLPISMFVRLRKFYRQKIPFDEIFYHELKEIEGHFGSEVCVYFKCIRFLLILNVVTALISFWFITLPQIILNYTNTSTTTQNHNESFILSDIITGNGILQNSVLFYGGYSDSQNGYYSVASAYFLSMLFIFLCSFLLVSVRMAQIYRKMFIKTNGNIQVLFSHRIFCSWEFSINHLKSANLKHKNIVKNLKEALAKDIKKEEEKDYTKMTKVWNVAIQVGLHVLVLVVIGIVGFSLYRLLNVYQNEERNDYWKYLYVPCFVNFAIIFCCNLFLFVSKYEEHKFIRFTTHIDLLRIFLLELTIVTVLLTFWIKSAIEDSTNNWETKFGQETYRIIITDLFIQIFGYNFWHVVRYILNRNFPDTFEISEFNVNHATLGLIFQQTIFWIGLLFSPLLASIVVVKMLITFYFKKFILIKFCRPPVYRSLQTQAIFHIFIFIGLLVVLLAHGYIITTLRVSDDIGPFKQPDGVLLQIFMEGILHLTEENLFWKMKYWLSKPAIVFFILLGFVLSIYYLRAKSKSHIAKVKLLKELLKLEALDKQFLLNNLTRLSAMHRLDEHSDMDYDNCDNTHILRNRMTKY